MAMDFMTCRGTCGNGVLIGTARDTMPLHRERTQSDLIHLHIACCAAVRGAIFRTPCASPTATSSHRRTRTATSVSAAPRALFNLDFFYPFTLVSVFLVPLSAAESAAFVERAARPFPCERANGTFYETIVERAACPFKQASGTFYCSTSRLPVDGRCLGSAGVAN